MRMSSRRHGFLRETSLFAVRDKDSKSPFAREYRMTVTNRSPPSVDVREPPRQAYVALAVGAISVSTGAIFVRYAQHEAASLTIAAYRMGIAFVVVLIPTMLRQRHELQALTRRDIGLAATSGLFLAVHFATWIYSLELTSVAISVVMVNTAPLWVGLLTPWVTRERLSPATILGIALSVLGTVAIGWGLEGDGDSTHDLLGGLLATIGALGLAVYLLIGRNLRRRHSLGVYVTLCYGATAVYLGLAALGSGQRVVGFSPSTWWSLFGLALVSQILGHTSNNWALGFFSASMIAVALLGEPICSTLMAYFLFGETLTVIQIGGAALILVGIKRTVLRPC
jgi:drug/metabolite transporter (DMT)-like permease